MPIIIRGAGLTPAAINTRINEAVATIMNKGVTIMLEGIQYTVKSTKIGVFVPDNFDFVMDYKYYSGEKNVISRCDKFYKEYARIKMEPDMIRVNDNGGYYCIETYLCSDIINVTTANLVICGVYVDYYDALLALPAGTEIVTADGQLMQINEDDVAPEMFGYNTYYYFRQVAGIAPEELLKYRLSPGMGQVGLNVYINGGHPPKAITSTSTVTEAKAALISTYSCPHNAIGPRYLINLKHKEYSETRCSICVPFNTPASRIIQPDTPLEAFMADVKYLHEREIYYEKLVEIIADLIGGTFSKKMIIGTKWCHSKNLFKKLTEGMAQVYPNKYWA